MLLTVSQYVEILRKCRDKLDVLIVLFDEGTDQRIRMEKNITDINAAILFINEQKSFPHISIQEELSLI